MFTPHAPDQHVRLEEDLYIQCWIEKEINYLQYTDLCVQSSVTVFIAGQYKGVILTLMHHMFSL